MLTFEPGTMIYPDALRSNDLNYDSFIRLSTMLRSRLTATPNGIENLWSLLKWTIGGTLISVEPFHVFAELRDGGIRQKHGRKR